MAVGVGTAAAAGGSGSGSSVSRPSAASALWEHDLALLTAGLQGLSTGGVSPEPPLKKQARVKSDEQGDVPVAAPAAAAEDVSAGDDTMEQQPETDALIAELQLLNTGDDGPLNSNELLGPIAAADSNPAHIAPVRAGMTSDAGNNGADAQLVGGVVVVAPVTAAEAAAAAAAAPAPSGEVTLEALRTAVDAMLSQGGAHASQLLAAAAAMAEGFGEVASPAAPPAAPATATTGAVAGAGDDEGSDDEADSNSALPIGLLQRALCVGSGEAPKKAGINNPSSSNISVGDGKVAGLVVAGDDVRAGSNNGAAEQQS